MKLTQVLEMDLAVLPLVDRMMEVGMKVDIPYLLKMGEELGKEMEDITYQVRNLTKGIIINPGSGDQVARYLYEHQNIRPPKLTKSKARGSVSGEVLETLKMRVDDPVLDLIMDYKEREKVKGTYADQLPHWVKDDSRVHATLRATRVASGRFSSTDPNLLAQPKRSELGKRIRGGFVAPKGCVLFSADLSQIELRVLAHESQDERLLDVFRHGRDLHDETEQRVFGTSGKRRIAAKTCNFGIVYGLTSRGLQMQLRKGGIDWTTEECQEAIDGWFRSYPKVWEYQDKMVAHARRYGYVKDMWGRIRYLPAAKSTNRWLRAEAERVAGNHGIQAGAQGVIKRAMKAVWEWLPQMTGTECLLQIHDELLFQCPTQDVELLDIMVRSCLTTTTSLSVPIEADSSWGKRWSDL
jgi:DNA polymerase-1